MKNPRTYRRRPQLTAWFLGMAIALAAFGCAKAPTEEMNAASEAVTRAENDADAVAYAPHTVSRARDALTMMQEEADAKHYDSAKTYAAEAVSAAERAIEEGKAGAERARSEAAGLIESLAEPLEETEEALTAARDVEGLAEDLDVLQMELDTAKDTAGEARRDLADGNYQDAAAKGEAVRSSLGDITSSLSGAVQQASRKK